MTYKTFTTFRFKLKFKKKNTIELIREYIGKKCQYIGLYKLGSQMYVYVQLQSNSRMSENHIRNNFMLLGEIHGLSGFMNIEKGLQLIKDEGVLIKRGPKKGAKYCTNINKSVTNVDNSKHKHIDNSVTNNNITNNVTNNNTINLNPVGKEDTSGIRCESIINMIKKHIDSDVINCKEDSKNCICYTSSCELHKKIGCESVNCRLSQGDRKAWQGSHTNTTCETFTPIFSGNDSSGNPRELSLDKFLYVVFIQTYCFSDEFRFYNMFEELLYKNIKNHNISIGNKDGKYSYFDGTEIVKGALMDNYYEDVIKKRISLLSERIDEIFEYWYKLEESYGYLEMHALKYFVACLVDEISDLDKNQTQQETKELRNKTVLKTRYSDIGIIREMVHASKNRCKDNPIRTG